MKYLVLIFFLIAVFFRFYNISWGAPFFFHPDERNIASSVNQLIFPSQMNPHFFAYGSIPLYTIYFFSVFLHIFHPPYTGFFSVSFEQAIIMGRIISAILSISIIVLIYKVGEKIGRKDVGIIASLLSMVSIGLIQFAHFATFEMWLTCFSLLLTYLSLLYISHPSKKKLSSIGICLGILIGIKISSLVLLLPVFFVILLVHYDKNNLKTFTRILFSITFILFLSAVFYFVSNPYVVLDKNGFLDSMQYETSVATGKLPVFYTQGFSQTIPVYYQFTRVYPFLLNIVCTVLFILSFFYTLWKLYKIKDKYLFIVLTFFLILFTSQAFLFVKWTRYLVPTLPYIYLIIAYMFHNLFLFAKKKNKYILGIIVKISILFSISVSFLYATSFFYLTYIQIDTRIQAVSWAEKNMPKNSRILSEVYDLGIVPFNSFFPNISLFNFYDLETNSSLSSDLENSLNQIDYIILPSQRIVKNRILSPTLFPKGNQFYSSLLYNKTKYQKIYETPCNLLCLFVYNGNPTFSVEETASVFDRPMMYIFKKI